ncbi:hypothetical protein SAMN05444392_101336 [Seinonella peptonophila]|uniref:Uncharacterized protein n=1 Tax=Seinonella peptonophila TaxID=112248 RepID=A0A1M4T759_9BACL|nr:hypothetical protein [Seinonella peptonophila]SHE40178.1 hypothetical protein SAMN05444392_101336 [Seinonella peptonophila]
MSEEDTSIKDPLANQVKNASLRKMLEGNIKDASALWDLGEILEKGVSEEDREPGIED